MIKNIIEILLLIIVAWLGLALIIASIVLAIDMPTIETILFCGLFALIGICIILFAIGLFTGQLEFNTEGKTIIPMFIPIR